MTLSLQNTDIRTFFNTNLADHVKSINEAVSKGKTITAVTYLEYFYKDFQSLKGLFRTETKDIETIKQLQDDLFRRVRELGKPTQEKIDTEMAGFFCVMNNVESSAPLPAKESNPGLRIPTWTLAILGVIGLVGAAYAGV